MARRTLGLNMPTCSPVLKQCRNLGLQRLNLLLKGRELLFHRRSGHRCARWRGRSVDSRRKWDGAVRDPFIGKD